MSFNLELNKNEIELILVALNKMEHGIVRNLFDKIVTQSNKQAGENKEGE